MSIRTRIDRAGRLVVPKELRDRYGLTAGAEVDIVPVPNGITLVPHRPARRLVRHGRVVAIDTGEGVAPTDVFEVHGVRASSLDRKTSLTG